MKQNEVIYEAMMWRINEGLMTINIRLFAGKFLLN